MKDDIKYSLYSLEERDRNKWRIETRPIGRQRWVLASWNKGPACFGSNAEALKAVYAMRLSGGHQAEFRVKRPAKNVALIG